MSSKLAPTAKRTLRAPKKRLDKPSRQRSIPKLLVWVIMSRPSAQSVRAAAVSAYDAWARATKAWESALERPAGRARSDTITIAIAVTQTYREPKSDHPFAITRACRSDAEMRDLVQGFDAGLQAGGS